MSEYKPMVCIEVDDGMRPYLTVGNVYMVRLGAAPLSFYKTTEEWAYIEKDDTGTGRGAYAYRFTPVMEKVQEEKEELGEFIVWLPDSPISPTKRYFTYKQARFVARQMSGKHHCAAYVMRAECVYNTVSKTTKEEL